jgi:hypothetical protein
MKEILFLRGGVRVDCHEGLVKPDWLELLVLPLLLLLPLPLLLALPRAKAKTETAIVFSERKEHCSAIYLRGVHGVAVDDGDLGPSVFFR